MLSITHISRNPFAREDVIRTREEIGLNHFDGCDFCGKIGIPGKGKNKHKLHLYKYGTERDGLINTRYWYKGIFCSISCFRAYHGL